MERQLIPEKKVILLVEDDAVTGLAEKMMLEKHGYTVITAMSGAKAIEAALNTKIDLILMDIDLGGDIDGNRAAQEILSKKNVPVVFLTAHVEREMVEKVRKITRYGYALKNSGEFVLLSSIEMVFDLFEAHEKTRESEENHRRLVEEINEVIFSMDENGVFTYISPRIEFYTGFTPDEITGRSFEGFIIEEDIIKAREQIILLSQGKYSTEEYRVIKKYGEMACFKTSSRTVIINGIFEGIKGLLMDITSMKKSEERMKVLLLEKEQLLRELKCLYNISRIVEENPGPIERVLPQVVVLIPEALGYPECSFAGISYNGKEYISTRFSITDGVIEKDLVINGRKAGLVTVGYHRQGPAAEEISLARKDAGFIDTVTDRIGRIIELSIARNELKKLEREVIDISERERQMIGHELHDSLGQILTGVSFMLKTVQKQLNGSRSAAEKINEISDLIREATQVCRQITRGLPAVNIQNNTLILALDQLAITMRDIFNVNCEIETSGVIETGDDFISSQLYRITQEAVTNAVKHSMAKNIYISLRCSPGIHLAVRDDGLGFTSGKKDNGMGLSIMKYRADLINGEFSAVNHADGGFEVSVKVP
jgi:PAS domain S-box-containing protein